MQRFCLEGARVVAVGEPHGPALSRWADLAALHVAARLALSHATHGVLLVDPDALEVAARVIGHARADGPVQEMDLGEGRLECLGC